MDGNRSAVRQGVVKNDQDTSRMLLENSDRKNRSHGKLLSKGKIFNERLLWRFLLKDYPQSLVKVIF